MFSVLGDKEAIEIFGQRLRAHRLHRNMTQAHVAKVAGISIPTLQRLEKGDGSPSFANVAKVLGVLNMAERLGEVLPEIEVHSIKEYVSEPPQRARASRRLDTPSS